MTTVSTPWTIDPATGRQRTSLAELDAWLTQRRAELDLPPIPRNTGTRRTASKRALLKAIEDSGGKW